jgi:NADH dehydrogenase
VAGYANIFAVGDQCLQEFDTNYPQGHPQLAQVAIQQSTLLADNIFRLENNIPLKPFAYKNKGSMAIISKYRAVVDLPKSSFKGTPAWLTWLFVHIIPLVGFRNKLKIALNWFWSFCTNDPTLRLVIRPNIEEGNIDS